MGSSVSKVPCFLMFKLSISIKVQQQAKVCFLRGKLLYTDYGGTLLQNSKDLGCDSLKEAFYRLQTSPLVFLPTEESLNLLNMSRHRSLDMLQRLFLFWNPLKINSLFNHSVKWME